MNVKKIIFLDLPGDAVDKNPSERQGTWVPSLVWEDCTCRGAVKPMRHFWACAREPVRPDCWACVLQLPKPERPRAHALQQEELPHEKPDHQPESSPHSPQLEKARAQQQRPSAAKNKCILKSCVPNTALSLVVSDSVNDSYLYYYYRLHHPPSLHHLLWVSF